MPELFDIEAARNAYAPDALESALAEIERMRAAEESEKALAKALAVAVGKLEQLRGIIARIPMSDESRAALAAEAARERT